MTEDYRKTPLFHLHQELGGKIVPFAGYGLPLHYSAGIMAEHRHCRDAAGLFDVSHMGQAYVHSRTGRDPATALERIMPGALASLQPGQMRYTLLLDEAGGIMDDLMVTRTHDPSGSLYIVVNAACKDADYDRLEAALGGDIALEPLEDNALLALQGPKAVAALAAIASEVEDLYFMEATSITLEGVVCWVSRSGYTGEDGVEISVPAGAAEALARRLLRSDTVQPVGLGARDSLRLEAGLCLSGQDFDTRHTPLQAGLGFAVPKSRLNAADFAGAARLTAEIADGPAVRLVGLRPEGRAPVRTGAAIEDMDGAVIGTVTSGGFGPTVGAPVALGYVGAAFAEPGTAVMLILRGRKIPAVVSPTPFVPQRYKRRPKP